MHKLCPFVSAPALSHNQIDHLGTIIHKYITSRIAFFPSKPLRPKHDFVMHYSELMFQFGPLKHVWTLRFESKHNYFKNVAESVRNFKNVHMMLAEKPEFLQALLENQYEVTVTSKNAVLYNPNLKITKQPNDIFDQ